MAESARAALDDHPELAISPAFVAGVESGGAGAAPAARLGAGAWRLTVRASNNLLPTLKDSICTPVDGICSCVASPDNTCNTNNCSSTCSKVAP